MEREHPEIIQSNSTVQSENEIYHQHEFKNHVWRQFCIDIFVVFPTIGQ